MRRVVALVCAVVLGVIVMMPPLLTAPLYYHAQTEVAPTQGDSLSTDLKGQEQDTQSYSGRAASSERGAITLSNILYAGSIVALGLAVAVGVFSYAKRKVATNI
ncbi:MAG: hypothetical protein ACETWE_10550 [Candidatus Bathyarchaeia archaeon]